MRGISARALVAGLLSLLLLGVGYAHLAMSAQQPNTVPMTTSAIYDVQPPLRQIVPRQQPIGGGVAHEWKENLWPGSMFVDGVDCSKLPPPYIPQPGDPRYMTPCPNGPYVVWYSVKKCPVIITTCNYMVPREDYWTYGIYPTITQAQAAAQQAALLYK